MSSKMKNMYVNHRLIYSLLLTATIAFVQSCTMENVVRNVIPWDPNGEDITISTDGVAGNNEMVYLFFFDDNNEVAGGLTIHFTSQLKYQILYCSASSPFPSLPASTEKTWRISYDQAALRLTIHCNEVEVLNVVLTDSVCSTVSNWRDFWERSPTKMRFAGSASDQYCYTVKECTDPDWTGIVSSHTFPVEYGTEITLRCKKNARQVQRHVLFGDKLATCQEGDSFTLQNGDKPNCRKLGISSLKKMMKSEDGRLHIPTYRILAD